MAYTLPPDVSNCIVNGGGGSGELTYRNPKNGILFARWNALMARPGFLEKDTIPGHVTIKATEHPLGLNFATGKDTGVYQNQFFNQETDIDVDLSALHDKALLIAAQLTEDPIPDPPPDPPEPATYHIEPITEVLQDLLIPGATDSIYVPDMASSTQEGYIVTTSDDDGAGTEGYHAFSSDANSWSFPNMLSDAWIEIQFPAGVAICDILTTTTGMAGITGIEASTDGTGYTTLTFADLGNGRYGIYNRQFEYTHYRFTFTRETLGVDAFVSSISFQSCIPGVMPEMTSASQEGIQVSDSDHKDEFTKGYNVFNATDGTLWELPAGVTEAWLKIEFPEPRFLTVAKITGDATLHRIEGSRNPDSLYKALDLAHDVSQDAYINRDCLVPHRFYRLHFTDMTKIWRIEIFGTAPFEYDESINFVEDSAGNPANVIVLGGARTDSSGNVDAMMHYYSEIIPWAPGGIIKA